MTHSSSNRREKKQSFAKCLTSPMETPPSQKDACKDKLRKIVERNHDEVMDGYDYDGIAEGVLRYLKIIK